MNIKLIVAFDNNKGIGLNNNLPWKLNEDLKKFKKVTKGNGKNAIIMGKNTWISLPKKPLPDRDNLILSSTLNEKELENKKIFNNIDNLLKYIEDRYEIIWIIGGRKIYEEFIKRKLINELVITEIDKDYLCDCFFPHLDFSEWKLVEENNYIDNNLIIKDKRYNKLII